MLATSRFKKNFLKLRLEGMAIIVTLVFATQLFWILPMLMHSGSGDLNELLSRSLFVSFSSLSNAITLYHPFWTEARPATFVSQPIPVGAYLLPIVMIFGLIAGRKKFTYETLFWLFVGIIGVFLVKQENQPFQNAYEWLFTHVPTFNAFRESTKFYIVTALSYSILIVFALDKISSRARKSGPKIGLLSGVLLVSTLSGTMLFNAVPLINGTVRTMFVPREIPQSYNEINNYISSQPDSFKTLWMPAESRWTESTVKHPKVVPSSIYSKTWARDSLSDLSSNATLRDKAINLLDSPASEKLLSELNIKYVAVPSRDIANEDDFLKYYGNDRKFYIDKLDGLDYLKKVNMKSSDAIIYENTAFSKYISSVDNLYVLDDTAKVGSIEQSRAFDNKSAWTRLGGTVKNTGLSNSREEIKSFNKDGSISIEGIAGPSSTFYSFDYPTRLFLQQGNGELSFIEKNNLELNNLGGSGYAYKSESIKVGPDDNVYVSEKQNIWQVPPINKEFDLGYPSSDLRLHRVANNNILKDANLKYIWSNTPEKCAFSSGGAPQPLATSQEGTDISIKLTSYKDTNCIISKPIALPDSFEELFVKFKYQTTNKLIDININFNDQAKTVSRLQLKPSTKGLNDALGFFSVPEGADSFQIEFINRTDYRDFTGPSTLKISGITVSESNKSSVRKQSSVKLSGSYNNSLKVNEQDLLPNENIIINGNFDDGLWQSKVGDCNNFDDKPELSMRTFRENGNPSLELSAKRHTACTSKLNIGIGQNQLYRLAFRFQSPNSKFAGFNISYNDPAKTNIERQQIKVNSEKWNNYSMDFRAPLGATSMTLAFYSKADDNLNDYVINRYDDVSIRALPEISKINLYTDNRDEVASNNSIANIVNQSAYEKKFTFETSSSIATIAMSELYDNTWSLYDVNGNKVGNHIKLNDWKNGWQINVAEICSRYKSCVEMPNDRKSIKLIARLDAGGTQRLGLKVGVLMLIGVVLYIVLANKRTVSERFR